MLDKMIPIILKLSSNNHTHFVSKKFAFLKFILFYKNYIHGALPKVDKVAQDKIIIKTKIEDSFGERLNS